jgi:hypothetical protein
MSEEFLMECPECGTVRKLSAVDQEKILATLVRRAQSVIVECVCHRYQFSIASRPIHRRELAEAAR